MRNFKISILVAIAALMITSCDKNVTMVTEINRDGTCTRQVSTADDCLLDDESWEQVESQDTSAHKKVTLRRSFSSVEEMSANPILSVYGEPVRSEASLKKTFKWFYTDYTFTETFMSWRDHFDIPITKYVSQDEASFMWTGYPDLVEGMTGIEMVEKLDEIQEHLEYYDYKTLAGIIKRSASILNIGIEDAAAVEIAMRSRGTPRIANNLLRRVRDFAQVKGNGEIDLNITKYALNALNIDKRGLDAIDNKILTTIIEKFKGGPVGASTIATAISEDQGTFEEVYEPFLIKEGFIVRTQRGRIATELSYKHLGLVKEPDEGSLFG
jgi:hypothetical protein